MGATPFLTIRRGGRVTDAPPTIGRREKGKNARATEYCNLTGLPVPCESGYVKTRRYKQDAKDKAFRRGAYLNVRDPRKTQSDKVLRRIFAFRSINQKGKSKSSPFIKESFSLVPYSRRKDGGRVAAKAPDGSSSPAPL